MKKLFKRIGAYIIDTFVLVIFVSLITNTSFINKQLKSYNKYYDEYLSTYNDYEDFTNDLEEYYEDEELSSEEYDELIENYPNYQKYIDTYYTDNIIDSDEYDKLEDEIESAYNDKYIDLYYNIEKNSLVSYIAYIVITILYFGLFNVITNGQTLGKKIFRLKVVSKNGENAKFINYLLRSLILFNSFYYLAILIGVNVLNKDVYYTYSSWAYQIQYYIQLIIMLMITIRKDGRGLHDFIGGTKVIALDKDGNEILEENYLFNDEAKDNKQDDDIEVVREPKRRNSKKKVIDMETSQDK